MQEFVKQGGLEPMLKLLAITPLAAESSYSTANSAIVDTCKNILVCYNVCMYMYIMVYSSANISHFLTLLLSDGCAYVTSLCFKQV